MHQRLIIILAFCAATSFVSGADTLPPQKSPLLKFAILPFENRTPNPNMDWVSTLFIESYRTALQKRFRFESASEPLIQKSLELLQDYRVSGKARFQVFAAMTGADVVIGGYFSPASDQTLVIQSEIYFTRSNRFEQLERLQTPVESAGLFASVERSAHESVATIAKNSRVIKTTEGPVLSVPYLPRVLVALPVDSRSTADKRALKTLIEANLSGDDAYELVIDSDTLLPDAAVERQKFLTREGFAYAIVSEWSGAQLSLSLYSPLKVDPLAVFTGSGSTREKSAADAMRQMSAFIRGWRFHPHVQVTGLKGKDLQLELSGIKKRETSTNGHLQFEQELSLGTDYVITLGADPHSPQQRCFILNATGRVTITGTNNVAVVCITQRYVIEGTVEGLTGGEIILQVNDTERVTLKESAPFRIPDTFEDYEPLRLVIHSRPTNPPQQCDFISSPARVMGKKTRLRLYCMPLLQNWLTVSGSYPLLQGNSARSDYLSPSSSFPLNNLSGRFGVTAGYWARHYFRYNIMVGGEATYSYYQGTADLYTSSRVFVESGHTLYYHGFGLNAMGGYPFRLPGKFLEHTRLVAFVGIGPRYVSLRSSAPITLLSTIGPGAIAGFNWYYELGDRFQAGIRYHADLVYISSEPVVLQHAVGLQLGFKL